jgi:hypothetical protein
MNSKRYRLPTLVDRSGRYAREDPRLVVGDHAKLGFRTGMEREIGPRAEWLWIQVTSISGEWPNARYRGELRNLPIYVDLSYGQPVEFECEQIYAVVRDSEKRPLRERESFSR